MKNPPGLRLFCCNYSRKTKSTFSNMTDMTAVLLIDVTRARDVNNRKSCHKRHCSGSQRYRQCSLKPRKPRAWLFRSRMRPRASSFSEKLLLVPAYSPALSAHAFHLTKSFAVVSHAL